MTTRAPCSPTRPRSRPRRRDARGVAAVRERPNILLVMADQLAAAHLPAYGNGVVHAPRLSALAAEGAVFESAYCASPLCAPSRFALLAGRRAVTHRCVRQRRRAPRRHSHDRPRPARRRLRHGTRGQDALRRPRSAARLRGAPHHGRLPVGLRLDAGLAPAGRRAPRVVPQHHEPAVVPDRARRRCRPTTTTRSAFRAVQKIRDLSLRRVTSRSSSRSRSRIRTTRGRSRQRYWDLYDEREIDAPVVGAAAAVARRDAHSLRLRDMIGARPPARSAKPRCERARHGYYAAISYLDERVGEAARRARGDRARPRHDRRLHRRPRRAAGRARALVQDVVPRGIRARAADRPRPRVCGRGASRDRSRSSTWPPRWPTWRARRPMMPASRAAASRVRSRARPWTARRSREYLAEGVRAPAVMIRRGRHKYIRCPGDPDLLYDLEADPLELRNLAADAAGEQRRGGLPGRERRALGSRRARARRAREPALTATRRAGAGVRCLCPLGLPALLRRVAAVRAQRGGARPAARPIAARRRPSAVLPGLT